jgi:hypothetical protein
MLVLQLFVVVATCAVLIPGERERHAHIRTTLLQSCRAPTLVDEVERFVSGFFFFFFFFFPFFFFFFLFCLSPFISLIICQVVVGGGPAGLHYVYRRSSLSGQASIVLLDDGPTVGGALRGKVPSFRLFTDLICNFFFFFFFVFVFILL